MKNIKARTVAGLICGAIAVLSSVYGMTDSNKDATVYVVKQGDTLWNIAIRFNASPWLWPKLWEQNKYITNPHLIYPGEQITLLPSSAAPLTGIAAAAPVTTAAQPTEEAAQLPEQEGAPPTTEAEEQPMEQPEEQAPPSIETATPYGMQFVNVAANTYVYPSIGSSGFLATEKLSAAGEIVAAGTSGRTIFGEHDVVFINLGSGSGVKKGDQFSIYETGEKVYDPGSGDFLGYKIRILGVLKVTKVEDSVSTADIVSSYKQIKVHDKLVPYEPGTKNIDLTLASNPIEGYVLCGKTDQKILGEDNIVYIDRGSNNGVQVGNTFVIYRDRKPVEDPATGRTLHLPKEVLGKLLVISVHNNTSTAIITKSVEEIGRGDKILADTASGII
ncbi:MAG: LysM peptidoglycan-binding domain-containing protein [Deltaproteobacteria bacterium]|nr:LysM peptidoglycan-binding domain-containing protein [Deltaproteobacteria bacterium]MCL5276365.1 LysM peptidoglycan-binding domain-containing protein [Deltaproteobacteria bacterium]